jgi:hypothetical protein
MNSDTITISRTEAADILDRMRERIRHEGDCRVWLGAMGGAAATVPVMRHKARTLDARRVYLAGHHPGQPVQATGGHVSTTCDRRECLSPLHVRLPCDVLAIKGHDAPEAVALLRFLRSWNDRTIADDIGAAYDACGDDDELRRLVRAFARARRAAPGYRARSYTDTSRIPADKLAQLQAEARRIDTQRAKRTTCDHCGEPFTAKRSTARYCSATCRGRAARRQAA